MMKEVIGVKCPFCGGEMKDGALRAGGVPKWQPQGERSFTGGRVIRNVRMTPPVFEAQGKLCERCGKLIIDVKL